MRWCYVAILLAGLLVQAAGAALPGAEVFHYHARRWSVADGLPQVTVTAVVQDQRGFVWVGTQDGVARFDGTQFKVFNSTNTPALGGNHIDALALDDTGRLWVATRRGLAVRVDGHFKALPARPAMGAVLGLAASRDGLWLAAEHGLFKIDAGQLAAHLAAGWPTATAASRVTVDPEGRPWVAVKGGIYGPGTAPDTFQFYPLPDAGLSMYAVAWFAGHLWAGTNHGLYEVTAGKLALVEPSLAGRAVDALLAAPDGYLWLGTDDGLFRIDAHGDVVDFAAVPELEGRWIWSLAADRSGDLWIGTGARGVIRLWNNGITWFGPSAGLADQLLTTVYRDRDGSMLVGGRSGVYRYAAGRFTFLYGAGQLPNPLVHGMLRTADGQLWIATIGGLAIMQAGRTVTLPPGLASLTHASIYNLRQDADGSIWISTADGLFRYADHKLQRFGAADGLGPRFVRGTFRAADGALWVLTNAGAYRYAGERFQPVCVAQHVQGPVADITQGTDGTVWLSMANGGLYAYAAGQCRGRTLHALELAGSLYAAKPDGHGHLWLTNARGVYRVAIAAVRRAFATQVPVVPDVSIASVDGQHQIHAVGGSPQAGMLAPDGRLWVPTVDGLLVVDTRNPPMAAMPAPVVIESVTRDQQVTAIDPGTRRVTLPPGKADLAIAYTDLDYHAPGTTEFEYRLSGYDANWVAAGTRGEALYTHLPPGRYQFEVRTVAVVAKPAPITTVELVVEPFFYQSAWFRFVIACFVLLAAYGVYAFSLRRVRNNQMRLEQLVGARTEELRAANAKLKQASVTDPLTGLRNRRYFMDVIEADVARTRGERRADALDLKTLFVMLDLDDFKAVNDEHGHHAGDMVLRQLGVLLNEQIRRDDGVIRWGGEEFLIIAHGVAATAAPELVEKLRAAVAGHRFATGGTAVIGCTCSMGYCGFPLVAGGVGERSWEQAVNLADAALYEAKRRGKNTWVGIRPTAAAATADPEAMHNKLDALIALGVVALETRPMPSTGSA